MFLSFTQGISGAPGKVRVRNWAMSKKFNDQALLTVQILHKNTVRSAFMVLEAQSTSEHAGCSDTSGGRLLFEGCLRI